MSAPHGVTVLFPNGTNRSVIEGVMQECCGGRFTYPDGRYRWSQEDNVLQREEGALDRVKNTVAEWKSTVAGRFGMIP